MNFVEKTSAPAAKSTHDKLFPLSHFYQAKKWALPHFQIVPAHQVPQPYKSLLVHAGDMTSVLQKFHRQTIHIEAIEFIHRDDTVLRQVRLCDSQNRPVEFGAIEIDLTCFPPDAQKDIIASSLPLGAILHKFTLDYSSAPQAFFSIAPDGHIVTALKMPMPEKLWGRVNVLKRTDGRIFAKVVEILPPAEI